MGDEDRRCYPEAACFLRARSTIASMSPTIADLTYEAKHWNQGLQSSTTAVWTTNIDQKP